MEEQEKSEATNNSGESEGSNTNNAIGEVTSQVQQLARNQAALQQMLAQQMQTS